MEAAAPRDLVPDERDADPFDFAFVPDARRPATFFVDCLAIRNPFVLDRGHHNQGPITQANKFWEFDRDFR
jgi:hypothetical protein